MPRFAVNLLPFAVWPAYNVAMISLWSLLVTNNPGLNWAIATLLPHGDLAFYSFIYAYDLAINLILTLPVALLLYVYGGAPSWGSIFGATLLVFIWHYWSVLLGLPQGFEFFQSHGAIADVLTQLGVFPLAYWLASRVVLTSRSSQ